jgi:hypothetical protein
MHNSTNRFFCYPGCCGGVAVVVDVRIGGNKMLDSKTVDMFPDFLKEVKEQHLKEVKEQQQPTLQEYAELFRANKADLWLENKKLRAALKQAAEIVAKNYCPADYDCPLEEAAFGGGGTECTQERAEKCWIEYWMGYHEKRPD